MGGNNVTILRCPKGQSPGQREPKGTSSLSIWGHGPHALIYRPYFTCEKSKGPKNMSGSPGVAQPTEKLGPGSGLLVYFFSFPLLSRGKTSNWRCDYNEGRHRTLGVPSVLEVWSTADAKLKQQVYYYYFYKGFLDGINFVFCLCVVCVIFSNLSECCSKINVYTLGSRNNFSFLRLKASQGQGLCLPRF